MKKDTSIMKIRCDVAPEDRQMDSFPSSLFDDSPYKKTQFTEITSKACTSGRAEFISNFRLSKVIIVGDLSVGKTSIVNRFCRKLFDSNYKATIGVDFEVERFDILKIPFNLQIWDTAGQERFKSIAQSYYRGAHAIMVVFDLTNSLSLINTETWLTEALSSSRETNPFIFLVGTKKDLLSKYAWKNMKQSGLRVSKKLDAEFWMVSAKTGENIKELFFRVAALTFDRCISESLGRSNEIQIGASKLIYRRKRQMNINASSVAVNAINHVKRK